MDLEAAIAKKLLEINAIKLNLEEPFTWASGMKSPIYCDNRISLSYPGVREMIKVGLGDLSKSFENIDLVAGVATAGIAHGALLADYLQKPFAYVRSKPKAHGRKNLIEGLIKKNSRVLVIEDLISTGMSSLRAIEAIEESGSEVIGVLAIFSYNFPKAKKAFNEANCKFVTLSNYPALLKEAVSSDYINEKQAEVLKEWNSDPAAWAEKNT